jgi:hypothetical protein
MREEGKQRNRVAQRGYGRNASPFLRHLGPWELRSIKGHSGELARATCRIGLWEGDWVAREATISPTPPAFVRTLVCVPARE